MSTIDVTDGLGPLRVADHIESLRDAMKLLRSMAVTLGSITRNHSDLVTSDDITSLTVSLDDLVSKRQVCLRYLDERSEARQEDIKNAFDATEEMVKEVAVEGSVELSGRLPLTLRKLSVVVRTRPVICLLMYPLPMLKLHPLQSIPRGSPASLASPRGPRLCTRTPRLLV